MVLKFKNINTEDWSPSWVRSKQPRKQRKYIINAPYHIRQKLMKSPLSEELRKIIGMRNISVRVGDYVKVLRGDWKGKEGYVIYVDRKRYRVYVDSVYIEKKNGEKSYYPLHPSKIMILKLNLTDKKRIESIKKKKGIDEKKIEELLKISITDENELKGVYELRNKLK